MYGNITSTKPKILWQQTILVVENDRDDLIYLTTALNLFNYRCLTAKEAIVALSLAQEEQPDLILLDLRLPKIDGIDLLKILKIDWLTRTIPIVAVTALAGKEGQETIARAGFDDYLLKPYLLADLEKVVDRHVRKTF